MVVRAWGYYGEAFKGAQSVTQGDPLSLTIFNVVVDAVVRHWVTMALAKAEKTGERGSEVRHQSSLFYADDGMVASSNPRWLQWVFDALVSLFKQVGLRTNIRKTVNMVYQLCQAAGTQSVAAYGRKMTGEGPTYREWQKERVECGECGKDMAAGSLISHRMTQHGQATEERWIWEASATEGNTQTYRLAFPTKGGPRSCPVEGCPGRVRTRMAMRMRFCNLYVQDIVIILEEGNLPHPRYSQCNMLVPWSLINGRLHATAMCKK